MSNTQPRARKDKEKEKKSAEAESRAAAAEEKARKRREKGQWKTYALYALGVFAIFVILAGHVVGDKPVKRSSKKSSKGDASFSKGDVLGAALRLHELAELAAVALVDPSHATAEEVMAELEEIEKVFGDSDDKDSKGLFDMAAQLRAQLLVKVTGLSEEELNKEYNLTTYGNPQYWENKYAEGQFGEKYDWYAAWDSVGETGRSLGEAVLSVMPPAASAPRVLVVGAGNSDMSSRLYASGFKSITNIDVSATVIGEMQQKYPAAEYPGMEWAAMDARKMAFEDQTFDVAVDKGTLDAVAAGQQDGDVTGPIVRDVFRVVKYGAPFVIISHSADVAATGITCKSETLKGNARTKLLVYVHKCSMNGKA